MRPRREQASESRERMLDKPGEEGRRRFLDWVEGVDKSFIEVWEEIVSGGLLAESVCMTGTCADNAAIVSRDEYLRLRG